MRALCRWSAALIAPIDVNNCTHALQDAGEECPAAVAPTRTAATPACDAAASSKLVCLQRMLPEVVALGEKAVIVSTSTKMLDIAEQLTRGAGLRGARIDGSTAAAVRQELVNEFNTPGSATLVRTSLDTGCSANDCWGGNAVP